MKFDLHCHTKEGSIDSKVTIERYIELLREKGFDGFMITDHNSYKGCKAWDQMRDKVEHQGFTVLRGVEYDTKDAGHILVIMPDNLYLPILNIRGMTLRRLLKIVHRFGGILGPAHPFGVRSSSAMYFKKMNMSLIERFDFIETFNTCESARSNELAQQLAAEHNLPTFAGSDAHEERYVGMAETTLPGVITCNNDLIHAVKAHHPISAAGTIREVTVKAKRKEHWTGVWGFKLYNRGLAKLISPYRKYHHMKLPFRS
ncbi:MAG: PHP domain-containing protein [Firmicutes bacterium]|nr:PHP domain-containing protein [Bacillota bacterium]